ncbi:alpha-ketoglutarate-dependent dioxygenase AlkB [Flavobacterium hydrophilum]|uniref:Alpha-ketoglutarate-dependent dioxygenase AlkB n=1 Tax=Flavobacterium hydrophilum TaxID=2211445 RepID=A0A2V4CP01_9FLAO|nr:alpha-ketoglutarate-dependent dioxygenase AlkB [Flavobacterium hydrophilum]
MNDIERIQGLTYIPNFINQVAVTNLINSINSEQWLSDLKRRVQHYGYKYDYKARLIDYSMFIGQLPNWAMNIAQRLFDEKYIGIVPDQLIINEYEPGQGIAGHVDCEPCFGDTIISLSLGSACIMDFINLQTKEKIEVMLESGSLVVLSGDARYKWTHGIAQRKADNFNGVKSDRKLRISMTFRKVTLK